MKNVKHDDSIKFVVYKHAGGRLRIAKVAGTKSNKDGDVLTFQVVMIGTAGKELDVSVDCILIFIFKDDISIQELADKIHELGDY